MRQANVKSKPTTTSVKEKEQNKFKWLDDIDFDFFPAEGDTTNEEICRLLRPVNKMKEEQNQDQEEMPLKIVLSWTLATPDQEEKQNKSVLEMPIVVPPTEIIDNNHDDKKSQVVQQDQIKDTKKSDNAGVSKLRMARIEKRIKRHRKKWKDIVQSLNMQKWSRIKTIQKQEVEIEAAKLAEKSEPEVDCPKHYIKVVSPSKLLMPDKKKQDDHKEEVKDSRTDNSILDNIDHSQCSQSKPVKCFCQKEDSSCPKNDSNADVEVLFETKPAEKDLPTKSERLTKYLGDLGITLDNVPVLYNKKQPSPPPKEPSVPLPPMPTLVPTRPNAQLPVPVQPVHPVQPQHTPRSSHIPTLPTSAFAMRSRHLDIVPKQTATTNDNDQPPPPMKIVPAMQTTGLDQGVYPNPQAHFRFIRIAIPSNCKVPQSSYLKNLELKRTLAEKAAARQKAGLVSSSTQPKKSLIPYNMVHPSKRIRTTVKHKMNPNIVPLKIPSLKDQPATIHKVNKAIKDSPPPQPSNPSSGQKTMTFNDFLLSQSLSSVQKLARSQDEAVKLSSLLLQRSQMREMSKIEQDKLESSQLEHYLSMMGRLPKPRITIMAERQKKQLDNLKKGHHVEQYHNMVQAIIDSTIDNANLSRLKPTTNTVPPPSRKQIFVPPPLNYKPQQPKLPELELVKPMLMESHSPGLPMLEKLVSHQGEGNSPDPIRKLSEESVTKSKAASIIRPWEITSSSKSEEQSLPSLKRGDNGVSQSNVPLKKRRLMIL